MATSPRLLLGLYAIVPLALAVVAADVLLFDYSIRSVLPEDPETIRWFTVFFVLPHIVASLLLYADAEYLRHYRRPLLLGLPAIAGALVLGLVTVGMDGVWIVYAVATVYHVLGQQFGVTRALVQRTDGSHAAWKWLSLLLALLLYAHVFEPDLARARGWSPAALWVACGILFLGTSGLAWRVGRLATSTRGAAYVWANQGLVAAIAASSLVGHSFFAFLLPRVIHDCTAFAFYVPHDVNRNRDGRRNGLYRALGFLPIPVALLGPLLAIGLAWPLEEWSLRSERGFQLVMGIGFVHYFVESFGWRRDGLPRRCIRLA